jgi:hypothetical protein
MKPLHIFYHCCDLPGAMPIILEQMKCLERSGLADNATVYLCLTGDLTKYLDLALHFEGRDNIRLVHTTERTDLSEWPTLTHLKNVCDAAEEEIYAFYFHLKGITHLRNKGIHDWRRYMEYWHIDRWQDCVTKLDEGYDAVGTNFISMPFLGVDQKVRNWNHFSGGFWWASSRYIKGLKKLPHPDDYVMGTVSPYTDYTIDKSTWRFDHEAWSASGRPKYFEIHRSPGGNHDGSGSYPGWHYHFEYPESNYK